MPERSVCSGSWVASSCRLVRARVGQGSGHGRASGRWHEPVANAAHRLDRRPVVAELLPYLGDMDVYGPRLAREVRAPDVIEEGVAREDHARITGQGGQQVKLARPQIERSIANRCLAPARVYPKVADVDRASTFGRDVRPPQYCLYAGDQRAWVERLGHVVVGAQFQPD